MLLQPNKKWIIGCLLPQNPDSLGRHWCKKERGFIQVVCNLGEWWTTVPKHIPSFGHGKSQQGQGKGQCPEFLLHFKVQSFGPWRQLPAVSSQVAQLAPSCYLFQAPSWSMHVKPTWPWAMRLPRPHGRLPPRQESTWGTATAPAGRHKRERLPPSGYGPCGW